MELLLLKSQKNEVFKLITEFKLDPFNFNWVTVPSQRTNGLIISKLEYLNSNFYFLFDFQIDKHFSIFSPGKEQRIEYQNPGSWRIQLEYFISWLKYLEREIDQPDLWARLKNYQLPKDQKFEAGLSNDPFTFSLRF